MNNKYAWTWKIKKENIDEYLEMHLNPWDEMMKEHSKAGIKNYSIFQNENQFFYCFECNDLDNALQYLANSKICQRWNAITSEMVEGSFDLNESAPIQFLKEIFYLE